MSNEELLNELKMLVFEQLRAELVLSNAQGKTDSLADIDPKYLHYILTIKAKYDKNNLRIEEIKNILNNQTKGMNI